MAPRAVFFALVLSIFKVQSQSIGCINSQSSSKGQPSCGCGPQPQTIQFQPSCNNGVKASPQLKIVPNQNCNLQAIPLSQIYTQSQGSNVQRGQAGCNFPKQNTQLTSVPQIPSLCAQSTQPQCNLCPVSAPVSTIPPTTCATCIDYSLCNCLANAIQMMIANDFIKSAMSNNIINQDCISIPVLETSVPCELSSFVKNLNANQLKQYQSSTCSNLPDETYDYGQLLGCLQSQCTQPKNTDWTPVLNYLNSKTKEPENDCSSFKAYPGKGKTAPQYQDQKVSCQDDSALIDAIKAYLGKSGGSCDTGNIEVLLPEEIPAELVCNLCYMPTTVPMISFSVEPAGDSYTNCVVGCQPC